MKRPHKIAVTAIATLTAFTLSTGVANAYDAAGTRFCSSAAPFGWASAQLSGYWEIQPPGSSITFTGTTQLDVVTRQAYEMGGGSYYIFGELALSGVQTGCNEFGK